MGIVGQFSKKAKRPEPHEVDALGNKFKKETAKKSMTVWLDPAVIKQFKVTAAEQDMEIQELMAEAINMVFEKYGKGQIA